MWEVVILEGAARSADFGVDVCPGTRQHCCVFQVRTANDELKLLLGDVAIQQVGGCEQELWRL